MSTIVISEDRDLRDSVAAARRRYRLPRCLHRSARRLVSSRETGNAGRRHVLLSPGMQKRRLLPSLPRSLASHGARRRPKTATANTGPHAPNRSPPGTASPTESPGSKNPRETNNGGRASPPVLLTDETDAGCPTLSRFLRRVGA
jgi:hypothetical protein